MYSEIVKWFNKEAYLELFAKDQWRETGIRQVYSSSHCFSKLAMRIVCFHMHNFFVFFYCLWEKKEMYSSEIKILSNQANGKKYMLTCYQL